MAPELSDALRSAQRFEQSPQFEGGEFREAGADVLRGPFAEDPRRCAADVAGDEMDPASGDRPVLAGLEVHGPGGAATGEVAHVCGAAQVDGIWWCGHRFRCWSFLNGSPRSPAAPDRGRGALRLYCP